MHEFKVTSYLFKQEYDIGGYFMGSLTVKNYVENNINIHVIPTQKFKTIHFILKMKAPLERETITARALLPSILREATKNHPSRTELEDVLDELYGAGLGIGASKHGGDHVLSYRLEVANDKFIPSAQHLFQDAANLFQEVIYNPLIVDNQFDSVIFEREKETLRQRIRSLKDDKLSYAQSRLVDTMCANEPYAIHGNGYEEDLDKLTAEDVYRYYQEALGTNQMDLYVVGDVNEAVVREKINSTFFKVENNSSKEKKTLPLYKSESTVVEKVEYDQIQQAKLHIGYRTNIVYKDEDYPVLLVLNGLFGGFPSSKLFLNVREKHSLAYYAASRLESYSGLLFVFSGIAPEDYTAAREIIMEQFTALVDGDFSEGNIQETKDLLTNDYLEILDDPQGIVELLYQQVIGSHERLPMELINAIQEVTKADIHRVAQQIKKDTIYVLTNKGGHK